MTLVRYAYDGDGARRQRLDSQGTLHYAGSGYERNVGTGGSTAEVVTQPSTALGRLLAVRQNGGLEWIGTDHLGSTARVADASFVAVDQLRYLPFGGARDPGTAPPTDHRFTGQGQDPSTVLNAVPLSWYGSRAYDPGLRRFCQPDSVVPAPGEPQSLNRYASVRNQPLGRVDPSGHWDLSTLSWPPDGAWHQSRVERG